MRRLSDDVEFFLELNVSKSVLLGVRVRYGFVLAGRYLPVSV